MIISSSVQAQIINIPQDQATIQAGIDAATSGDTVLVSPGVYYENLNMKGKSILLASWFETTGDLDYVSQTIINGSQPTYPDTASCILIISDEDRNCIISGFTLTGGTGTKWEDEHNRGYWYTEGGGILVQAASPTIRNNIIRDNEAINKKGSIVSAGGGAIRCGDSNPLITNNYIDHNQGLYGAGIVLNYSGAIIKNNIIVNNTGGKDFGGGGLWILGNSEEPKMIENNTIVNNSGSSHGGGIRLWNTTAIITNNVIRGNHASAGAQIHGTSVITYCNIQGGRTGEGNIDELIRFTDPAFLLPEGSSSIDAGNAHSSFFDVEDPSNPGTALYPSQGTLLNDMGAYGGPGAQEFPAYDVSSIVDYQKLPQLQMKLYPNPANDLIHMDFPMDLKGIINLMVYNYTGQLVYSHVLESNPGQFTLSKDHLGSQSGNYIVRISSDSGQSAKHFIFN